MEPTTAMSNLIVRVTNLHHPHMQIEDVLTYDRERMKYVKTQHVHQLLVGRCVLAESSQGYPQIRKEQVSLFLLEDYNTIISIQKTPSEINSLLLARIMYAGSKIRLNGPRFLLYAIVDSIVDELFPILRLIRKKLKTLHSDVTSAHRTSLESVHLIQHVIREANLLLLWLSPLSTVASRLQAELPVEGDTELKKHLEDLVDHVHALKEQTSSMVRCGCVDRLILWKAIGWWTVLILSMTYYMPRHAGGLGQVACGRGAQRAAVPHEPGHLRPDHDHGCVRDWGSGLIWWRVCHWKEK